MAKGYDEKQNKKETEEAQTVTEPKQNREEMAPQKTVSPQLVISVVVLFIFAVFAVVNTQEVAISFVFTDINIPLIIVILGSFILGVLTAMLTSWRKRRKTTKK